MQAFIDFIFHEVWCKAPTSGPFGLNLFDAKAELREVMEAFYYSDAQGADFFYGHVERIYGLFSALLPEQIDQFQQWYQGNNDLENVCANDPAAQLARYADIAVAHKDLGEQLGSFFKGLYSQSLLNLAALRANIGNIDDHYQAFATTNKLDKCPFCGINDLLGEYHTKREAYDHYLPKALYPFNSINFKNLVPACHHCNSSYKTSKDLAYTPKDPAGEVVRRKAFYPFSRAPHFIDLQVTLQHADIEKMVAADINLTFGPANIAEQIDSWKDVYGIEERYRGKLLGGDGKAWLVEVLDEWRWNDVTAGAEGKSPDEYLRDVGRHAEKSPYANANFLKNSFLRGCKAVGLFDPIEKAGAARYEDDTVWLTQKLMAKAHAESEFEKYRIVQDRLFESDFDREIKQIEGASRARDNQE